MNIHFSGHERPINHDVPRAGESKLIFLGGLMGLTPSFRAGGNGQSLAEAASQADLTRPTPQEHEPALWAERIYTALPEPVTRFLGWITHGPQSK